MKYQYSQINDLRQIQKLCLGSIPQRYSGWFMVAPKKANYYYHRLIEEMTYAHRVELEVVAEALYDECQKLGYDTLVTCGQRKDVFLFALEIDSRTGAGYGLAVTSIDVGHGTKVRAFIASMLRPVLLRDLLISAEGHESLERDRANRAVDGNVDFNLLRLGLVFTRAAASSRHHETE